MTPAPNAHASALTADGVDALDAALDDMARVTRRLRSRDITGRVAADLIEAIRSRIVVAHCRALQPPQAPNAD